MLTNLHLRNEFYLIYFLVFNSHKANILSLNKYESEFELELSEIFLKGKLDKLEIYSWNSAI